MKQFIRNISFCAAAWLPLTGNSQGTPLTPAQWEIVQKYRRMEEEASAQRQQLDASTRETQKQLFNGDLSFLDAAVDKKDITTLWHLFGQARINSISSGEPLTLQPPYSEEWMDRAKARRARNEELYVLIAAKLAEVPGHAVMYGDRINQMSGEKGHFGASNGLLVLLGDLGSMEAIQQLGRFLDDQRNPEENFWPDDTDMPNPERIGPVATRAMHKALGALSPAKFRDVGYFPAEHYKTIQDWWKSDAAKPYREWRHETHEPMPPPRLRAKPLMAVQPGSAGDAAKGASLTPESASGIPVWLLITLCASGIAAATLLAARKRRR